jgi:hypothetical protein
MAKTCALMAAPMPVPSGKKPGAGGPSSRTRERGIGLSAPPTPVGASGESADAGNLRFLSGTLQVVNRKGHTLRFVPQRSDRVTLYPHSPFPRPRAANCGQGSKDVPLLRQYAVSRFLRHRDRPGAEETDITVGSQGRHVASKGKKGCLITSPHL